MSGNDESVELTQALNGLRAAARKYRRVTGSAPSKIMGGGAPIVHLNNDLLSSAVCVAAREYLLAYVPTNGVCCEVGTSTGFFARAMVQALEPSEVHLVDMDYSRFQQDRFDAVGKDIPLHKHEGISWDMLASFDKKFDYIYIDAGHSYRDVKRDIEAALKAVKPNGYLMFNDYTRWSVEQAEPYGVIAAVNELALEHGWAFRGIALSGSGHFDILLSASTPAMDAQHKKLVKDSKKRVITPSAKEKRIRIATPQGTVRATA